MAEDTAIPTWSSEKGATATNETHQLRISCLGKLSSENKCVKEAASHKNGDSLLLKTVLYAERNGVMWKPTSIIIRTAKD